MAREMAHENDGDGREDDALRDSVMDVFGPAREAATTGEAATAQEKTMQTKKNKEKTPGEAYVAEYLAGNAGEAGITSTHLDRVDGEVIAQAINDGALIACPRCHFLRLSGAASWRSLPAAETALPADCDVCAAVPYTSDRLLSDYDVTEVFLTKAREVLDATRQARASALFTLWIGQTDGAEALCWAEMAAALDALRARAAGAEGGAA